MSRSSQVSNIYPPLGLHYKVDFCTLSANGVCPDLCSHREEKQPVCICRKKCKCKCKFNFSWGKNSKPDQKSSKSDQKSSKSDQKSSKSDQQSDKKSKNVLHGFTVIPLTLQTNDGIKIPTETEVKLDHQSLADYLNLKGMVERIVMGDGNCQYRALADQLFGSEDNYEHVKEKVIEQLKKKPEDYAGFVYTHPTFDHFLMQLHSPGKWGDAITLQAAADAFAVSIFVFSIAYPNKVVYVYPPSLSIRDCYVSHWAELHYNSVYYKYD